MAKMIATLPTRRLGNSGLQLSTVGFGAWAAGGGGWAFGWGPQDDAASIASIRYALERGVNWIDTAAVYGLGHSEEVVGERFDGIASWDRPYVFTKCGMVWDERDPAPPRARSSGRNRSGRSARHRSAGWAWSESISIRFTGPTRPELRSRSPGQTMVAAGGRGEGPRHWRLQLRTWTCCSGARPSGTWTRFSRRSRSFGGRRWRPRFPGARRIGTGVIVYSPLQSGLLTENFSRARVDALSPDDWRRRSPEFKPPRLKPQSGSPGRAPAHRRATRTTTSAVAIAWTLAWPGVTGAIVGARSPEQVDGWIGAATLELTLDDLDEIAPAIGRSRGRLRSGAAQVAGGERSWASITSPPLPATRSATWTSMPGCSAFGWSR